MFRGVFMKFLRNLLEELEVLYKFSVEVFNSDGDKVDQVYVIAGNGREAQSLAVDKSTKKGKDATRSLVIGKEDIE